MAEENINQGFSLKNVAFESAILINVSMAADSLAGDLA